MASLTRGQIQEAVARARARIIGTVNPPPGPSAATAILATTTVGLPPATVSEPIQVMAVNAWSWNAEQKEAITNGVVGKSFVLIGAAGTGKTTTLKGLLQESINNHSIPMLKSGTEHLSQNTPGVVLVSFTRRAVRNIAKQMPPELKTHCLTIHKLLEYAPEIYYETNEMGVEIKKMRFSPSRNSVNPLPVELLKIIIDESSMVDIELFDKLLDALPSKHRVQFIFLGDLNQLPPVYGHPILGQKLLQLPIVELTQVYRQALESPIIALALAVKNNNFAQFNKDAVDLWSGDRFRKADGSPNYMAFDAKDLSSLIDRADKKKPALVTLEKPGRGKVTIQVWKNRTELEVGLAFMQGQLKAWIDSGYYQPDEDLVLCPWNKSFGTTELNKAIADKLGKTRNAEVYEVIAGFNKFYFAVGDKLLVDKQEAIVLEIQKNPKYFGKRPAQPSTKMDRWGNHADRSISIKDFEDVDIDDLLADLGDVNERTAQCSHILKMRMLDSDTINYVSKANDINNSSFAYAITVHKAQGSECRKVIMLTHYCHSAMLYRELVYTAVTRAAEELHIIMSPMMLEKAARSPRIKGDTLKAKLEFYAERLKERLQKQEQSDDE